jgi:mRNA interferase MazF
VVNRGEVWWVATRTGRRPYMILTRQHAIPLLTRLHAVPATTVVRGVSSELLLDEDDGMPRECVLSFDDLQLVPRRRFLEHQCTIHGERLEEACRVLAATIGCGD